MVASIARFTQLSSARSISTWESVGEHLGYLTGIWSLSIDVGVIQGSAIPAWLGWLGIVVGAGLAVGSRARGDPQVGKSESEPSESQLLRGTIEPTGRRGSHRSKGTSRAVPISPVTPPSKYAAFGPITGTTAPPIRNAITRET